MKDWIEVELKELSSYVIGGDWGKDPEYEDPEYNFVFCIRGAEFKNWKLDKGKTASLRKVKKSNISKRKLIENDILVEISGGGPDQPVGRTIIIGKETFANLKGHPVVCTNFLRLFRPVLSINARWLNIYLEFFYHSGGTIPLQAGSNNLRNLKFPKFEEIKIPLTSLPEQRAIVARIEELFSELDHAIANLKSAQAKLEIYRQAVLKKAFEGYEEVKFEEIILSSQNGLAKRKGTDGTEIKVLRLADVSGLKIDDSSPRSIILNDKEFEKYKLVNQDLVVIRVNGSIDLVGRFIHINEKNEFDSWAFCDHFIRFSLNLEKCSPKLYFYFFQLPSVRKFIHQNMVSSAGQNTVSQGTIKNILVPLIPIEKQNKVIQEIESRLSVADKLAETIQTNLEKSESLRQSILKKAFEGELLSEQELEACQKEADWEPAEKLLERIKSEKKKK